MEVSSRSGSVSMDVDVPSGTSVSLNGVEPLLYPAIIHVGYVYSAEMTQHAPPPADETGHQHPETPARIERIFATLVQHQLHIQMKSIDIREVLREEALLVHTESHWDKVMALQEMTETERQESTVFFDGLSLYVCPGTTRAALLSCGGVIEACLAVVHGIYRKSFAIVRPPGHHAEPDEHMGFCFFNNVAVAAKVVQQVTPLKRIMILDWDVHHGNGTQRAFNHDSSILYISIHRYDNGTFYPCSDFGSMESSGEGEGKGFSVNIPWPEAGMGDADYIHAFQKVVMPIAMEFAPELVIISAGFDAAAGDTLGGCLVSPIGYAHMTHMLSGLAGGRLVVALEGGYNVDSISKSALAVTQVLLGEAPPEIGPMVASEIGTETVWLVAKEQSKYWRNVDPRACEPTNENPPTVTYTIPEILKAHRQHYMYTQFSLLQVPLMSAELEDKFGSQVMCTDDILDNETLIVFIHQFGNLRLELANSLTCDVSMERSYLIDSSKMIVEWVKHKKHALLDINMFPKRKTSFTKTKNTDELSRDVLTYLWDNYIQLAAPHNVVLVGHGPGCTSIIELLRCRTESVMKTVKCVVQVVGNAEKPAYPKSAYQGGDPVPLRSWFRKCSLLVMPEDHPSLVPEFRDAKRHKQYTTFPEHIPVKLIIQALPFIELFVDEELAK